MADLCGGDSAAGNPARSGIDRANAAFNAAAALNAIAETAEGSAICATASACYQSALDQLDSSVANQRDTQIDLKSAHNRAFVIRRQLERATALRGLASIPSSAAGCGGATACLTEASRILQPIEAPALVTASDPVSKELGCRVLDTRWRVNVALGRDREHQYVEDLTRVAKLCPAQALEAEDKLADIAFDRAERIRTAMSASAAPSVDMGFGAISSYKAAANSARYQVPALRGMGEVYERLAAAQPGGRASYLEQAIAAYQRVIELDGAAGSVQRAEDHDRLGMSRSALAVELGSPGSEARLAMHASAADAFRQAVTLVPTPGRYVKLAEAAGSARQYEQSVEAYQAALPNLSGARKTEVSLALVGILDRMGNETAALALLKEVSQDPDAAPQVAFEIGLREFRDGKPEAAYARLVPVVGKLSATEAAEAHYMISVAEFVMRKSGWQARAVSHADRAIALNAGRWSYVRQDCLAHIVVGGRPVKSGESLMRCPDEGTAEAGLLRGMYLLKQAQLQDVSAYSLESQSRWRETLRAAEAAFDRGLARLATGNGQGRTVPFDDLSVPVDLEHRLGQGKILIDRCTRQIELGPQDPVWKDMEAFFGVYGVLKCS
ncbi:hypothetical protein [Hyphomonas sp.]|uniref:tetratricopeptide repeat protein n=1 Tax=Hyphomonas sp. TaxID=87 RepID=UPI0025BF830E|nr:hypothetical protein [Hyphomonas sp.]